MWVFFFQAEDGIRDLVRSRGLGDVYKRQEFMSFDDDGLLRLEDLDRFLATGRVRLVSVCHVSVSYTHLTLPTSDLV